MAAQEDISLHDDQIAMFIDLWETHPCLWDPANRGYRDKTVKLAARTAIAKAMGTGWTEEQVERKTKSLRGHYNTQKRKLKKVSQAVSAGVKKLPWLHFERIRSFLSATEYDPQECDIVMQCVPQPSESEEDGNTFMENPNYLEMRQDSSAQPQVTPSSPLSSQSSSSSSAAVAMPSIAVQLKSGITTQCETHHSNQRKRAYTSLAAASTARELTESTMPKTKKGLNKNKAADPLEEVALRLSAAIESNLNQLKQRLEHQTYGAYVAERLATIKSKRTVMRLKREIDTIIDNAIMAEISD